MTEIKTANEIMKISKQKSICNENGNRQRNNGKQTKQTTKGKKRKIKYVQGWT